MAYRIKLLSIGKTKEKYLQEAELDYSRRIKPYATLEVLQLRSRASYSSGDADLIRESESELLQGSFNPDAVQILLDERGRQLTSREFAGLLGTYLIERGRRLEFVIGGPWGGNQQLRESCDQVIALSRMTFNHRLIRVFLLEQLYRAFQILQGGGYAEK